MEASAIAPQLAEHGVRLVGVGVEDLGVEEFVEKGYFAGELYVDEGKKSYQALGFKKMGYLSLVKMLVSSKARAAYAKAKTQVDNNLEGDWWQNGGAMVVGAGGKELLYSFRQENSAEHADNMKILQALGISTEGVEKAKPTKENKSHPQCSEDVCQM